VILTTLVAAVALGITAQVLAERFQIPAILPLLTLGILLGPSGMKLFEPHSLGGTLEVLIHLGVAIILFEGGLSLDPARLRDVGAPVRNLLTIGVAVTGIGAAVVAHELAGLTWPVAALFGAVVTVTGPTVIVPLLRHMIAPRDVKTVLLSEGLIIDPIGAVLAYLVLQWIERVDIPLRYIATELIELSLVGIILGFVAGALAKLIVRSRVVTGELRNLSILALLMVCYLVAEERAPQSGILAAMVMGFTMSASELPDLNSVKAFKGQLTTLVISVLFILLAGQLKLGPIAALGWTGAAIVAALVFIVRPLSVVLSVWPSHMGWRERTVLAMTAPRGIVAAAVASLAARQMDNLGLAGGSTMEGLVYLTILVTGAWSTLMAVVLPRALGYASDPSRRRAVFIGANALTEALATRISASGRLTIAIDAVPWRLDRFRDAGISVVPGDARDSITYEEAGVERDSLVFAATTNDELNLIVAELAHAEFGVEHPVVALQTPPHEFGRRSRAWMDLLGGRALAIPRWISHLENGQARLLDVALDDEAAWKTLRDVLREHGNVVVPLLGWVGGEPSAAVENDRLADYDLITLVVEDGHASALLEPLVVPMPSLERPPIGPAAGGSPPRDSTS
jgi:NhaP-type Na+/H+ or K+/H+ antiporter